MYFVVVALVAAAQLSAASTLDYKFSHDPISMGLGASLLSNRINSADYLLPDALDEVSFSQHRQLADYAGYGEYAPIFESKAFPPEQYVRFQGLDETALFATSVSISNDFAIIGSNGYNIYQGIVHVYTPVNVSHWDVHSTILSPDGPNINFGLSVDHSGKFLIVGANALDAYKGAAYIYQYMNDKYWILTTRLYSPFGVTQGFGFKVAIDGNTAVVATAINDVCIYEYDTTKGSWKNTLKLTGLASTDRFGNSIDVYNNYVVIGAPQAVDGRGIVYVYKQNSTKGWNLDHYLNNDGNQKQFGYSVSIYNSTLAVGAVGHRDGTFKPVTTDYEANTGYAYLYEFDYSLQTFEKKQDIQSPVGHKSYFGVFVNLAKDKLIVGADGTPLGNDTGAAFVYFRKTDAPRNSAGAWQLNYSLPSPAGSKGHFGYAVDICDDFAVSGAYGFDDLRGSVYLIGFPKTEPTFAPTLAPTDSGAQSFNTVTSALAKQKKMMEILGIGVLALVAVLTSACCIYLCCIPVAPKKKKKEEEEESPYTVHSYVGYSEMDEYMPPQAPPPQWMPFFSQMPMMPMMMVPPPPPMMPMMQMDMEKKKMMDEKDVDLKKADENFIRKLFPYKVYGPRGYEEDGTTTDTMDREKREAEKASEGDVASSSSSDDEHSVHYTAERQQSRKPFSMETIRESEHEDESSSSSARSECEAAKNSQQNQRALPYTYSSQYNMQGFQQYDMSGGNNTSQFFAPSMHSSDEVSTLSSQPSSQFYGAPVHNPQMFAPPQPYPYPQPPHMQPMMMPPPPAQQHFVQQRAPADYSSDSSSQLNAPNYVSMAKQSYAKFKQQSGSVRSGDDDDASVSTMGSSVAPSRPVSVSHSDRVRSYANERSSSDLASTTSNSDDSFVKRAKERYMQFLMKKNMTREEREADDLMREQSYAFLQSNQPQQQEDEEDDATVSTMTGTVHSASTGFYSESSTGSSLTQRSSNSFGGVLNLRPTSMQTAPANVMAPPAPVVAPVVPSPVAPPMPPVAQSSPARNTLFKVAATDRNATALGEAPSLRLTKKIEFEELDEIKEVAPPVRQTSLLASKPVATISGIEERELKEVKPMAAINRPLANSNTAASTLNIAEALEHEVEEARQKAVEELERARALAQSMAAEEELKRIQDRNRLKEETRLRAEERARAQFALHKQQQQQQQQTTRTPVARTTVTSTANETLLAAERALASVQQISVAAPTVVTQVINNTVVNNTVNRVTTQNATVTNTSVTNQTTRTTQPRIEEP